MTSLQKTARLAGLLYLILIICGIINLMYIPSKLIIWEDVSKTFENITNNELLFRIGIVTGIIAFLTFLLLPLLLYQLLNAVNKAYAALMVIFALASIPISFVIMLHKFAVLSLIDTTKKLHTMKIVELQSQVMLQLEYYNNGIEISQIFWGLWLLPFGYLVYKSGFLPKIFGILLMMGCFGYLITFFAGFLYPHFYKTIASTIIGIPASVGEIGICLWLLIKGVKKTELNIPDTVRS